MVVAATMDLYDYRRSGKTAEELGWFDWPPACDIWNKMSKSLYLSDPVHPQKKSRDGPRNQNSLRGHLGRGALAAGITYPAL